MNKVAKQMQGKTANAYKLVYKINIWQFKDWQNHMLSQESHIVPAKYPWKWEEGLYIHVLNLRTTSKRIDGAHEKDLAKLVSTHASNN